MTRYRNRAILMATTFGAFALHTTASAQVAAEQPDAPEAERPVGLTEIIVTAQRRTEPLQDVPIAISAFDQGELERRNINEALDIIQYVPNLQGSNNVGLASANSYFLRGVGDTESLATKDPPIGTYVDDIYFARQIANNFALFDVERIEVLRGPQGTLFGRNTTGGAIVTVLEKPQDMFGGRVEASYGRFNFNEIRASVDLPVSDRILTKFSAFYNDDNGYAQNVTTGETVNEIRNYGARAAIRLLPKDYIVWDIWGVYLFNGGSNLVNFECNPLDPTDCDGRFVSTGLVKDNGGRSLLTGATVAGPKSNLGLGNETETYVASSNLTLTLGDNLSLQSITGFVRTEQSYLLDFFDGRRAPAFSYRGNPATGTLTTRNIDNNVTIDPPVTGLPNGGLNIANIAATDQFTQELKLDGTIFDGTIEFVTGAYYFYEDTTSDFADTFGISPTTTLVLADRVVSNTTEAIAAYVQADAQVSDTLKLTAGVRYTDEDKSYDFSDNRPQCQAVTLPTSCIDSRNFASVDNDNNPATPAVSIPLDRNTRIFTPRFAVVFEPDADLLLFASATRGFKSGGLSGRATQVRLLLPFEEETVWSYEGGVKAEFFDRKLRVNAVGFYANTSNLQGGSAFVTQNANGTQSLNFVTRNFASFENKGLELEIQALPYRGLNLYASLGYQDPEYKIDFDAPTFDSFGVLSTAAQLAECRAALANQPSPLGNVAPAITRAGASCGSGVVTSNGDIATPVRAPELSLAGGASYKTDLTDRLTLTPAVNVSYTSDQEVGSSNTTFYVDDQGVANLEGDGRVVTGSFSKATTFVNASVSLAHVTGWRASVECSNCFDAERATSTLSNYTYLTRPMTWRVRLGYRF